MGTKKATKVLQDEQVITVDGEMGNVYLGAVKKEARSKRAKRRSPEIAVTKPITATEVKVNVSNPEAAQRASRPWPTASGCSASST